MAKVKKTCEWCGKEYEKWPSQAVRSRFCSRFCHGKFFGQQQTLAATETRICPICGTKYETTNHHGGRKTCSQECANILKTRAIVNLPRKPRVKVKCAQCGETFYRPPSRIDGRTHFCNQECHYAYRSQQGTVQLICEVCRKPYKTVRYFAEAEDSRKSRYYSRKCKDKGMSIERIGKGNPMWEPKITLICITCGKEFDVTPCFLKQDRKCCSFECAAKYKSKTYRRENHWLWKGGRDYDYGPDWRKIAAKIRKRDNYTCQICGLKHKGRPALHVHHIVSLREFNGDYEKANQSNNLITLCPDCHAKQD